MPDGHTAIANWDSGEPPVPNKSDSMLDSFDSDFIDGGIDDALTGVRTSPAAASVAAVQAGLRSVQAC